MKRPLKAGQLWKYLGGPGLLYVVRIVDANNAEFEHREPTSHAEVGDKFLGDIEAFEKNEKNYLILQESPL